jgi:type IV conjugative transfer system coupling protein TraD
MQKTNPLGQFTRGMESFTHLAHMFGAGLRRQLLLCFLAGLLVASWSIWVELRPEQVGLLVAAVGYDFAASVVPDHVGTATLPSGEQARVSSLVAANLYADALDGRPGGFVLRQWLWRSLFVGLVIFPLLLVGLTRYGRKLREGLLLRGSYLKDTTTWAYRWAPTLNKLAVGGVAAVGLGLAMLGLKIGWAELWELPSYGFIALANAVPSFAELASPSWDGATIWVTHGVHRGLVRPAEAMLLLQHLSLGGILGAFGFGAAMGGASVAAVFHYRKPRDTGELELGGLRFPRKREVNHFLISGTTGAGKSVAATHLLDQIRARGQRAIIYDTKGEFVSQYYRPDRDVILNPFDARSCCWTPWADARKPADYLALGKSLFPEGSSHDKFWQVAGASLFAALSQQALVRGYATNSQLARMLTESTLDEVKEAIEGTAGQRFMDDAAGAMPTNLLATLSAHLEAFRFLPDVAEGQTAFSIKDFIERDEDRWLFVVMRAEDEGAIRPLVSLWYDVAINAALSLPCIDTRQPEAQQRRIWAFLDELARLQKLPALEGGLREGRAKGLAFVLGLQSIGDVRAAYGRDKAEAMLGQPQTRLVLRTPEPDTAAWLERNLGRAERSVSQESQSMGASAERDGVSIQRQTKDEAIVLAGEIQKLPDLTGYLSLPTGPVYKVRYEWTTRPHSVPGFVAKDALDVAQRQAPVQSSALSEVSVLGAEGAELAAVPLPEGSWGEPMGNQDGEEAENDDPDPGNEEGPHSPVVSSTGNDLLGFLTRE